MKNFIGLLFLLGVKGSKNGGSNCYTCMIVGTWIDQYSRSNNVDHEQGLREICPMFGLVEPVCEGLLVDLGSYIKEAFGNGHTVDTFCYCLGECYISEDYHMCNFFPLPENTPVCPEQTNNIKLKIAGLKRGIAEWCQREGNHAVCNGAKSIQDWFEGIVDKLERHVPAVDSDGDLFSSQTEGLRGTAWRGTDCSDTDPDVYPGTTPVGQDRYFDSNCNKVSGLLDDGVTKEDGYCANTGQIGVAILGDSAGAHFAVPEIWFRPQTWKKNSNPFVDAKFTLTNELDWPMMSWVTGFTDRCWETAPISWVESVNVDSIYARLVDRNRCNLNDFQNQANNGCKASSMADNTVYGLARDHFDTPMLIFLSLIGNDICNGKVNTEDRMTTPEEFYNDTMKSLWHLESILPVGSAVILTGLVEGEVLWDLLSERYHPLGEFEENAKYSDFYGYMECLEVSPCVAWMSADAERRRFATERAQNLTDVAEMIATDHDSDFKSFELIYMDYPIREAFANHEANGGEAWQGIEITDGFHPSQTTNVLLADIYWKRLLRDYPHVLGEINPNNDKLAEMQQQQVLTCDSD